MILTTRIRPNTGIMINKFKETGEEEVILPSGTYSIKYSEILTFKDKYHKKGGNEVIESIKNREEFKNVFPWLIKNESPENISDEMKHKIYLLSKVNKPLKYNLVKISDGIAESNELHVYIGPLPDTEYVEWFNAKDRASLISTLSKIVPKMLKEIFSEENKGYNIVWKSNAKFWIDFSGYSHLLQKYQSDIFGTKYRKLTSKDNVKNINTIKDPNEKRKAIEQYGKDIMNILKSII